MHLGETIESHSLHVFVLALPDFLGYPSAVAMAEKYGNEVLQALALKKYGNHIMEVTTGRMIHGENPTVGGFGKYPDTKTLTAIKEQAQSFLEFAEIGVELVAGLEIPFFFEMDTTFMCCEPGNNEYGLMGDQIRISTGEVVDCEEYLKLTMSYVTVVSSEMWVSDEAAQEDITVNARSILIGLKPQTQDGKLGTEVIKNILCNTAGVRR